MIKILAPNSFAPTRRKQEHHQNRENMEEILAQYYEAMKHSLLQITREATNTIQMTEQAYHTAEESLVLVNDFIKDYQFQDDQEQILYYKDLKPKFLCEYIYYGELYQVEIHLPVADRQAQKMYINTTLSHINVFFERNQFLYNYYRSTNTLLDGSLFLSDSPSVLSMPEIFIATDHKVATSNCFKLAQLQAFEKLVTYLEKRLQRIENGGESIDLLSDEAETQHTWTDSKVALIELAYALFCQGSVDNGKADIKDIIGILEKAFQVKLGNFYAVFQQNIRLRKKIRPVFMESCKSNLEKYMDDLDENPVRG